MPPIRAEAERYGRSGKIGLGMTSYPQGDLGHVIELLSASASPSVKWRCGRQCLLEKVRKVEKSAHGVPGPASTPEWE